MDVAFRGMQLQHTLIYLASLDDPSAPEGTVSDINMQAYAGFNTESYLKQTSLVVRRSHFAFTVSSVAVYAYVCMHLCCRSVGGGKRVVHLPLSVMLLSDIFFNYFTCFNSSF